MVDHRFTGASDRLDDAGNWDTGEVPDVAGTVESDQKLRQLLKDISRSNKELSILEVMWWIRTNTVNQAEIPQAIFRVGDQLASVIYLEECRVVGHDRGGCWEVQLNGHEYQFDTFKEVLGFIEQSRREVLGIV